ncbi:MAG: DUF1624 domain-containing protein [Candidatus Aenigmarchaeota archaeon]|nr:DUF1624 domain-containing protein [Candidatus Aenigmarchaeota archaeon]
MARFWELDAARGVAVMLMLLFNWSFTLRYFGVYDAGGGWFYWWLFPRLIAGTFIAVAGVSLAISCHRTPKRKRLQKFLSRGAMLFSFGLLVTLATWLFVPQGTVVFGILHFMGVAVAAGSLFVKLGRLNLVLGALLMMTGAYLGSVSVDMPWLLWLGLAPHNFYTFDYFPLLPWFGLFLMGIHLGNVHYPRGKRSFVIGKMPGAARVLCLVGRHSLLIYGLHQPLLFAVLLVTGVPLHGLNAPAL